MKCGENSSEITAHEKINVFSTSLWCFLRSQNAFREYDFHFIFHPRRRLTSDVTVGYLRALDHHVERSLGKTSLSISVALREMYIPFKSLPIFLPRAVVVANAYEMMAEFLI